MTSFLSKNALKASVMTGGLFWHRLPWRRNGLQSGLSVEPESALLFSRKALNKSSCPRITSDLPACWLGRIAMTNDLASVVYLPGQMASSSTSSFIRRASSWLVIELPPAGVATPSPSRGGWENGVNPASGWATCKGIILLHGPIRLGASIVMPSAHVTCAGPVAACLRGYPRGR